MIALYYIYILITSLNLLLCSWYFYVLQDLFLFSTKTEIWSNQSKMRWKMKHISSEQWCLKIIALNTWKKKNHLVSGIFKAYKLNTVPLISLSKLFHMSTHSLWNRQWREHIILLSSVPNLMTINKQGRKKYEKCSKISI